MLWTIGWRPARWKRSEKITSEKRCYVPRAPRATPRAPRAAAQHEFMSASSSPAAPRAIRWLHVPKAGSAFINVIARHGCHDTSVPLPTFEVALNFSQWRAAHPEVRCADLLPPWAGHVPARKHEQGARLLVGTFRQPSQRLLSGFHHREGGENDSMIAPGMAPATRAAMRSACRGDPGAYARWPGIAGCATKMLNGWPCASERALRASDVARAVHVVKEHFAFVGLLEHWATSVCVFHALLRKSAPIDAAELALTHPGPRRPPPRPSRRDASRPTSAHSALTPYDERALRGFVDAADERLYAAASARFWADAQRTGCVGAEGRPRRTGARSVARRATRAQ